MGKFFSGPKQQAMPEPKAPTPMPIEDDEALRRKKISEYAKIGQRGGRESTQLTQSRLGDVSLTDTRGGSSTLGSVG